jgi:hypothetical protein
VGAAAETDPSNVVNGWRAVGSTSRVTATDGTVAGGVAISWEPVALASGYNIMRSTGGGTPTLIATKTSPSQTSHTDLTAVAGTVYTYSIITRYPDPTGSGATLLSPVSTSDTGYAFLAAPTNVTASQGTSTELVEVRWNAVAGATMYQIERRTDTSSYMVLAPMRSYTTLRYYDRNAVPGVRYCYIVRAGSTGARSLASLQACGWRLNTKGPNPTGPGGGGGAGAGMAATDAGGAGLRSGVRGDGKPQDDGAVIEPPLDVVMAPIASDDPSWQLDCLEASIEEMTDAVRAGSRDVDGDGLPDRCQRERGDLDLDGRIDAADLAVLMLVIGEERPAIGDLTHDGCVDGADFDRLLELIREQQALDALEASIAPPIGMDQAQR